MRECVFGKEPILESSITNKNVFRIKWKTTKDCCRDKSSEESLLFLRVKYKDNIYQCKINLCEDHMKEIRYMLMIICEEEPILRRIYRKRIF